MKRLPLLLFLLFWGGAAQASCWQWSQTASANANADPTINWAEGMAPSSVNDSARAMMARLAECKNDLSGSLQDTGSSGAAYVVASNQGTIPTTPNAGQDITFTPLHANVAAATLAVDGGTAFPIQSVSGLSIAANVLQAGMPYRVTMNPAQTAWLLQDSFAGGVNLDQFNYQSTVTISIASPGVITWANHGLTANAQVVFSTTGALPSGLSAATVYYVVGSSITTNTFEVSATSGGSAISTSGTQSGTQTATLNPVGNILMRGTSTWAALNPGAAGTVFTSGGPGAIGSYQAPVIVPPQGYLTPCSQVSPPSGCVAGQLLPASNMTGVTTLYYTPAAGGNRIPIYNGAAFLSQTFAELTLVLTNANAASTFYDVCVTTTTAGSYSATGSPTLVTSVAWQTSSAGNGARGSSAAIGRGSGIWVNSVQITGSNNGVTYTIPAGACTIVGTVKIETTAGQVNFTAVPTAANTAAYWDVFNFYNRQTLTEFLTATSIGASGSGTVTGAIGVAFGLPEESITYDFRMNCVASSGGSSGIGVLNNGGNATGAAFATTNSNSYTNTSATNENPQAAYYEAWRYIGFNSVQGTASASFGAGSCGSGGMAVHWRG